MVEREAGNESFVERERTRAVGWKALTATLPDEARAPAPYIRDGEPRGMYPYCLPAEYAALNLLPNVRDDAREYFARERIAWHQPTDAGPTNHLMSSQMQCLNALGGFSTDPEGLASVFANALDIAEVLPIEPGRFVAFEFIGERDYLGEVPSGQRHRGTHTTSADAAIRYRTASGQVEVALIEWKYTEDYRGKELSPDPRGIRMKRYRAMFESSDGPIRKDAMPYVDLFVEPFYQLFRQQLLAWHLERAGELGATLCRVIHVSPHDNAGLRLSLNRDSHHSAGTDVFTIWSDALRERDRFVSADSSTFAQDDSASKDYQERYA